MRKEHEEPLISLELETDREAMTTLEQLIPEILELEAEKHGESEYPLMIHHIERPVLGGHLANGQPGEYFINFDLHTSGADYVLDIGILQVENGVVYDGLEPSELSVIYSGPNQVSTMMSRGKLDLVDFAEILQDYLRTNSLD